jgi:glycine/D-amino acid oxidase-like deaminating enzyme
MAGLAEACVRMGTLICCGSRATSVEPEGDRQRVATEHGDVVADSVVVATNTPFIDRVVMHTKQSGYRTYVLGFDVPKESVPRILLWDVGDPYYYVRLHGGKPKSPTDVLIVGGADHKVGRSRTPSAATSRLRGGYGNAIPPPERSGIDGRGK